jgi:hypothetical protein
MIPLSDEFKSKIKPKEQLLDEAALWVFSSFEKV